MKKILVVLLVLAVAGGVFAQQGEWTQSAGVKLNTKVDFDDPDYKVGLEDWEGLNGSYEINYNKDGLKATVGFEVKPEAYFVRMPSGLDTDAPMSMPNDGGSITVGVEYTGDTYAFQAKIPLVRMLMGDSTYVDGWYYETTTGMDLMTGVTTARFGGDIDKLWGYYKLMNGVVHLEAGYKGRDNNFWGSSDVGGGSFTGTDGADFALINLHLGNLDFGLRLNNLFYTTVATYSRPELVNDVFMESAVGVKFDMTPIVFAANFGFSDYKVYVGAEYDATPIKVGISFTGTKLNSNNPPVMAGVKLSYEPGVFYAGIALKYALNDAANGLAGAADTTKAAIGIEPEFWYNVLPEYFRFAVNTGFYFRDDKVSWKVEPVITWNFLGTGANGFGDIDTGMGVRYKVANDAYSGAKTNALTVGFRWKF